MDIEFVKKKTVSYKQVKFGGNKGVPFRVHRKLGKKHLKTQQKERKTEK